MPSRLEEQTYGFEGPWVGWSHHRRLIEAEGDHLTFVFKTSVVEREGAHFPLAFRETLRPEERVEMLWWKGGFSYQERLFYEPEELNAYLDDFVAGRRRPKPGGVAARGRRAARRTLRRART